MGAVPGPLSLFPPTRAAALERLHQVHPARYARSRNALDGDVTRLSPYFTHGIIDTAQAVEAIGQRHGLGFDDKLMFEFGWREYFHHVWSRLPGGPDQLLQDIRPSAPWSGRYASDLPADVREGRTGVRVIDSAVRQLYDSGYLHNHARLWLASYVVHLRKVHWRAGADWMHAHLLDGDLASNHLSWQWVAGTFSSKPYLFNADNVAQYAPASQWREWVSPGTVIDASYEDLQDRARQQPDCGPQPGEWPGVAEPPVFGSPPPPALPPALRHVGATTELWPEPEVTRAVELVHPWALSERPPQPCWRIGVVHLPAHEAWPWSEARWTFVLRRMADICDTLWIGDLNQVAPDATRPVHARSTLFPGYREALPRLADCSPADRLLINPNRLCRSFSAFYQEARQHPTDTARRLLRL